MHNGLRIQIQSCKARFQQLNAGLHAHRAGTDDGAHTYEGIKVHPG